MNITASVSSIDWKTNNKGVWKAILKDMEAGTTPVFSEGYTATVTGKKVTISNETRPSGMVTYTSDLTNAVAGGVLYGAGTVSDSLEAVGGEKTIRIGSIDLGTLDYTLSQSGLFQVTLSTAKGQSSSGIRANIQCTGYTVIISSRITGPNGTNPSPDKTMALSSGKVLYINDLSYTDPVEFKTAMSGVILYYELAEPTTSTETAQPMSLAQGSDTIGGGSFSATYEGTEYEIQLVKGCKYIHRDEAGVDHYLTPSAMTQLPVKGGVSKVIDLRRWFGYTMEPTTLDAFYKLYPTWKNYDIPYIEGQFVNYRGTGVQTIGFNAYNHSTGTAGLLGGNKYQICGTYTSVSYVDQWGDTEELELDADGIFTPVNNGTLTVVGGNSTDTCVHLCWSGYKNFGEREYQWEPFVKNVHAIDVTRYFPDGMNGLLSIFDELYTDHSVGRINKHVFTGEESITSDTSSGFARYKYTTDRSTSSGINKEWALACNKLTFFNSYTGTYGNGNGGIQFGSESSNVLFIIPPDSWGSMSRTPNNAAFKAKLKELYDAGNPLVVYYISKTPVTTQLPSPINLTYPVNDFGTEQSLPVNTTDLVTTDLHALIRYNTDYMRMNTQLSEIFPTVRSLAQQEQDGEIMKTDATAPNATVGNAYNLIDRNAAGTERQFTFDSSGGTQDIADGTAVAKKVMGTTLNLNQLVHDTNENTVESVSGNATVSDAVGGQVKHLVVSGDTVVVNQLVHEHVEKTESGTGRIWIKDAFEKEAKGLKVTAPRSVVVNQLVDSTTTEGWSANNLTVSYTDNVFTLTSNSTTGYKRFVFSNNLVSGHVYALYIEIRNFTSTNARFGIKAVSVSANTTIISTETPGQSSSAWKSCAVIGLVTNSVSGSNLRATVFMPNDEAEGAYIECRNMMCVDLTQYFNGNQTLIDSIQTWDDLVAYDSAFASYVQYNTGTVKGVTPALTLNGASTPFATAPQEMFGVEGASDEYSVVDGKYTTKIRSYTFTGEENWLLAYSSGLSYGAYYYDIQDKISGLYNLLIPGLITSSVDLWIQMSSGECVGSSVDKRIFVKNDSWTTPEQVAAGMAGKTVYYEVKTPVITDVTPVALNLVSHDNTIFQTSGDLQAGIEATYDGLNQTIALDPAHTYAFNHQYVEDSIITGESSIDCVGTEDNLVDLTQLYAGDATRIAAIHSWASLSSRIHMYRDWLPYNPGEIVNLSATIRVYQHEHAYGVVYDPSQSSPACQRVELNDGVITEVEEFTSLPIHEKFYRCVMDNLSTRHINYYLDDEDSTKKYNGTRNGVTSDGTSSVLTGADGDVMVEIPITYWRLDEDYNGTGKILWLVSDTPFTGSEIHDFFYVSPNGDEARTQYVGAYRAVVADAEGNALNTTEGAITQNAGTASTRLLRSVAGALPFNNVALASMREAAVRNGGSHVNHLFHEYLLMMMIVEQATLNCQSISMGYSNGKTYALWAWRKSGRTNYGNGTGQTMAVANTSDDDNFYSLKVNNVQLYRDANRDSDGYFAWSNHAATPTVYWTESNAPGNGATAYSDSTGTDSGYTTTSWSTTADDNKVIQFQYRGIENPFGEVWEFDDGMQKYQKSVLTAIKVNNVVHYVNHLMDGTGTKTAWTSEDGTSTYWTAAVTPGGNAMTYLDSYCTIESGYKLSQVTSEHRDCELWRSSSVSYYTSTDQHVTGTKVYDMQRNYWPSGSWIKKFDPRSFLPRTLGGSGTTYLCDNWYNDNGTGSRVVSRVGNATYGSNVGLACVSVNNGLTNAYVSVSGRLSA